MKQVVAVIVVATLGCCLFFMMSVEGDDKSSQKKPTDLPKTIISKKDGAEMVLVPSGEFLMESPEGEGSSDERPQHTVYLDAFYIDKYEVTNAQYKKFMYETGHADPDYWGS